MTISYFFLPPQIPMSPPSSSQPNTLLSISLINWSNLKKTFTSYYYHVLPSPHTYTVGAMCPLVRMSELSKVDLFTCVLGVTPSFYLRMQHSNLLFLLKDQPLSIYTGLFPSAYNPTTISFTIKQSKEHFLDLISPSSYGQISLLLVTAKVLERDVSTVSVHFSSSHFLSNPLQPGFHPHQPVGKTLIKVTSGCHVGYNNYLPSLGCAIYSSSET